MGTKTEIIYKRNHNGFWTRNGRPVKSVPDGIAKKASYMPMVCEIKLQK